MPETNGENVAAGRSSKSQKDIWDKFQVGAAIVTAIVSVIAAVVIPIVIGIASNRIQKSIAKQSVAKDYVGIAVSILERPKDEEHTALRDWAVDMLSSNSPKKFTQQQLDELKSGGLTGLSLSSLLSGRESLSAIFLSPDGKKTALMKTILDRRGGRSVVEVYDFHTHERISYLNVAGTSLGSSSLVWSQDCSKLLVGRSYAGIGYVELFDVAQKKLLREYQTKAPPSELEGLNFSEDGRSVIIKTTGGLEVWQLP
jgi:WD40 repeat protein